MSDLYSRIWEELSAIDVSSHTEKKNGLTYLSWAWAVSILKSKFAHSQWSFTENTYADGTMMVECMLSIHDGDQCAMHTMWLPVMDYRNKPIVTPNAFEINKTRMRCLTKCIAFFGLGMTVFLGEDLPQDGQSEPVMAKKRVNKEQKQLYVKAFLDALEEEDALALKELGDELKEDEPMMSAVWSEFSSKQKASIKEILDTLRKHTL